MKTALIFSGQGSQYVGMINDTFHDFPHAAELINQADEILGFQLSKICFEGPTEILKETRYTQPAIFLHSAVNFELTKSRLTFDGVAGHSVGEYAALFAAGVLDFESALKLVAKRGELMFNAGEEIPGTMFAVINLSDEKVTEVCKELTENGNGNVVVAANFNSPGQVVVSGSRDYLRENANKFKEAGARMVKELVVSGAFHSPLLNSAQDELEKAINNTVFADANVPVFTNVFAKATTEANELRKALISQLTSPVLWTQSLNNMFENGFSNFIEIGPGNVLQGLVKRTIADATSIGIDKSSEIRNLIEG